MKARPVLVLGGAECAWSDLDAALSLGEYSAVVACNDAAAVYPGPLHAAVSLHAEKFGLWMERRRRAGLPMPKHILGHEEARNGAVKLPAELITGFVPQMLPGQTDTGSSGHLALKATLFDLGFDKAVLCGVPMDERPHFFDDVRWSAVRSHWRGWLQTVAQFKDRARSMSGRTRDLLGAPTPEWLAS